MPLLNTSAGYGAATKTLHWVIAALFAFQLLSGEIMVRLDATATALGVAQAGYYNWHKSIGLLALLLAVVRLLARGLGQLPDWAPTLSEGEQRFIHRAEQGLYAAMFLMPVSGFLYVMAGGYGVRLFGLWDLANPIGAWPPLAVGARWVHFVAAWALMATLAGHIGLVLRHQFWLKDGLLRRMLP
ncbi:MAG: cytochrome b [Hyphomicrobiaceae bacterium]